MVYVFRFFSWFPLWLLHGMGAVVGWLGYVLVRRYRARWQDNCTQAGITPAQSRSAIAHAGRMIFELPRIWLGRPVPLQWQGLEHLDAACARNHGLVLLTPHLGCFEVAAQTVGEYLQRRGSSLTVLYRPARQPWLARMMEYVRTRPGLESAPTTQAGVRHMLKALRRGHAVGLLPDHVPPEGQGTWAPFFGKPAYTMTLAARLALQTGADMLVIWGERLPWGRGYRLHCLPALPALPDDVQQATEALNTVMEDIIRTCPEQYMWSYARYRAPRPQPVASPKEMAASE